MDSALYTLALLACPVGMGLMMFMMLRDQNQDSTDQPSGSADRGEVAALRAEIEALKTDCADRTTEHPQR
jgi:hypothetical protein